MSRNPAMGHCSTCDPSFSCFTSGPPCSKTPLPGGSRIPQKGTRRLLVRLCAKSKRSGLDDLADVFYSVWKQYDDEAQGKPFSTDAVPEITRQCEAMRKTEWREPGPPVTPAPVGRIQEEVINAARCYVEAMGPCVDAKFEEDESYCDTPDCPYCALAKAVDGVNLDGSE